LLINYLNAIMNQPAPRLKRGARKLSQKVGATFHLPPDYNDRLHKIADAADISKAHLVEVVLMQLLDRDMIEVSIADKATVTIVS